jgi:mono/diheme cytochrome c family protein
MQPRSSEDTKKTQVNFFETSCLRGCTLITWVLTATFVATQDATTRSVWQGVYTAAQSERGQAVYKASCASCHGDQLNGDVAPTLTGPFWAIWEGKTAAELFKTIRTTMPADAPESLKAQEYADLVAYLFSVNKFPAGEKELSAEPESLERVRITSAP